MLDLALYVGFDFVQIVAASPQRIHNLDQLGRRIEQGQQIVPIGRSL
jgi:hypothetical protein